MNKAILSCHSWFTQKYQQCLQRIQVPLLNHLLCLPMKFKFFCNIAKGQRKSGRAGRTGLGAKSLGTAEGRCFRGGGDLRSEDPTLPTADWLWGTAKL